MDQGKRPREVRKSSGLSYQSNVAEKIRLYEEKSQLHRSSVHTSELGPTTFRPQECKRMQAIDANDLPSKGLSFRPNISYGDSKLACDFSKVNRADEYKESRKPNGGRFKEKSRHPLDVDENKNDFDFQKYVEDLNLECVFNDRNVHARPRRSQADQATTRLMDDFQKAEIKPCSVRDDDWYSESYDGASSSSGGKGILGGEVAFGQRYFKLDKNRRSSSREEKHRKSTGGNEMSSCIPNLYEELCQQAGVKQDRIKTIKNEAHLSLEKKEDTQETHSIDDKIYPMIRDVIHEIFGVRDSEENNQEKNHLFKQHQDRINNNGQKITLPPSFDSSVSEEEEESGVEDSATNEEEFKQNEECHDYEENEDYQWGDSDDENYDSFSESVSLTSQDDSESDWKRGPSSSTSSSSRDSILSDESIVSTSKYGSVKRSITTDADGDGKAPAHPIKRLRSNEGAAVTPPDQQTSYSDSRSSSDIDSQTVADPNESDNVFYEPSPITGAEAGSSVDGPSYCVGAQADLPLVEEKYFSKSEISGIETQGSTPPLDRQIQDKSSINFHVSGSNEKVAFSKFFRKPKTPVPFQLHPTQIEDLHEYYCFMREKELVSHPSYCLKDQKKIKHTMRHILVEWITMIAHHYKLHGESVHLTVNILDRYTERQKGIYRGHYQLLGVTSLLVATKQLEVDIPPVATCLMLCRNLYSRTQLLSLERHLLDILAFDLSVPTAHTFLDYYIILKCEEYSTSVQYSFENERQSMIRYFSQLLCVSRRFLDFGLAEYHFTQFLPSVAARAAMLLAKEVIQTISYEKWRNVDFRSKEYSNEADLRSRESFQKDPRYADEAGYEDPMEFYRSLGYPRDARPYKAPFFNVSGCYRSGNSRYRGEFLSSSLLVEQDLSEVDDILECYGVLKSLVGESELENTRRSIDKVVEKYSFE